MTDKISKKKSKEKRGKKDKRTKKKQSGSSKKKKNYSASFSSLVSAGSEGSLQLEEDENSKGSFSAFECSAPDFAFGGNFGESASSLKLPEEEEQEEEDEPKSELDAYLASLQEPNPYKTQYITINPEERRYGGSSRDLTASRRSLMNHVELPELDASDGAWIFDKDSDELGLSISGSLELDPVFKEKLREDGLLDDAALGLGKTKEKRKKVKQPKKKSKEKLSKELFKLLNLDPYRKKARKKYLDYDVRAYFQDCPELAKEKYAFTVFEDEGNARLYPLSMLLALGASKATVKCCYEAYPDALHHVDDNLGTPLHYAAEFEGAKDVIEYLGEQDDGAFICVNEDKRTPLHLAAMNDASLPTLAAILAANPKALMKGDCDGNTPLHLACSEEAELDIIEEMMDENRNVCLAKSNSGATPLHLAIFQESSFEVIDSMVASNVVSLEVADEKGRIPLHVAASSDVSAKIVQLLIHKYPAGVQACTSRGKTPYALAKKAKRHHGILAMLKHDH